MSDAVQQFVAMTKAAVIRQDPQAAEKSDTQTLWCPACKEQTPHERTVMGWRCLFAYSHKLSERGHISRWFAKLLNWLVVILLILFVLLKDVPW